MATDNQYVSRKSFSYIWSLIVSKFVKKETFNQKIKEVEDSIVGLANADEVYVMSEGETEDDIPENAVVAVFPDEDSAEIDWSNYYNKKEINEIISKAEFKRGDSAYQVAVKNGFEGDEEKWLLSLIGKSAYEIACEIGFKGTPEEWVASLTPQKGVDYFDGYTPQKNVDYFDGYTPQRGTDYWTETDVNTIKSEAQNYIDYLLAELVGTAPDSLNTLWELANALGNDPNFATTVLNKIGQKVEKEEGKCLSSNDYTTAEKEKLAELAEKEFLTKEQIEAMFTAFEQKIASEYLGNYKWRVSNTASDGYVTVKKE